ncbi:MAG: EAL domain-containing protein, partial [Clostridia bacterium]|nr:EAL domain-containing protein [Clostridia bacterium]
YRDDLEDYHFTRLVILDREGNGTTSDGLVSHNYYNIDKYFAIHDGKEDEVRLSENDMSDFSKAQVNTYSRLFNFKGKDFILYAVVKTENYSDLLPRKLFNGKGGTYLINNKGDILIDSYNQVTNYHTSIYEHWKNTYNLTSQHELNKLDIMKNNIANNTNEAFDIQLGNETYFIHYNRLNVNDWYVITVIPNSVIANEFDTFLSTSFLICLVFALVLICIYTYINIYIQKTSRKTYNIAYIDPVTSLGKDTYFKENSKRFLENLSTTRYVMSTDIDKFKFLNSLYGYDFCNKILKELGNILFETLPNDNITCRMSNDIFASIFTYNGKIEKLIDTIVSKTSALTIDGESVFLNISIGIYKINKNDTDINNILAKSYIARSKTKGTYDSCYYIFDGILQNAVLEERQIEACMQDALDKGEFQVYYQPKVHAESTKVVGAEALVKWFKDGKMIPPNKFIPLFEKNRFILKLDLYIFEQVCKDMASWKETYGFAPSISINVSKEHFTNENFIQEYVRITDKYNLDRSTIDLEITESATVDED